MTSIEIAVRAIRSLRMNYGLQPKQRWVMIGSELIAFSFNSLYFYIIMALVDKNVVSLRTF